MNPIDKPPKQGILLGSKAPLETPAPIDWIRTEFSLPKEFAKQCTQYFLRVWTGNYVRESVQNGVLYGRAENWIVHWQSTPEVVASAKRVACSFREYKGNKYVVIQVWKEEE
jgi:hypothetical protein